MATPANPANPCTAILTQLNALHDKKAAAMKDYTSYLNSYDFHQASNVSKVTATCQGHQFMINQWDREINSQVQLAAVVCHHHSKI